MFRSKAAQEREQYILQRKLLSKDQSSCNQRQLTSAFQYEMCLFRNTDSYQCRKQAAKLAKTNNECKAIGTKIEELDKQIFPPRPGKAQTHN